MQCRQFFGDSYALFECKPLRDILRLQEDTGRPPIITSQCNRADTNHLEPAIAAFVGHVFQIHMLIVLECSVEYLTNDVPAVRVRVSIGRVRPLVATPCLDLFPKLFSFEPFPTG